MTHCITHERSQIWKKRWNETVKQENPFATMGRSSDTISNYFTYITDIINGLGGINKETTLLDACGGCGYISMFFSLLVKEVHLFDYSEEAIKKANIDCSAFENIYPYVDNLLTLKKTKETKKQYEKIFVGGALQYFDNYSEIQVIMENLFDITSVDGRIFISQTPDISLREKHISTYQALGWPKEKINNSIKEELTNRFWVDFNKLKSIALSVGFKVCKQTKNNPSLFQSSHMFDFYLEK